MASSKGYLEFVMDQLGALDGVTYRAMMGEYLLYCRGKIVGGVYDDRLLVKITESSKRLMPDAPVEIPYEGGRPMLMVEDVDDREFLCGLIGAVADELPEPKKKNRPGIIGEDR